eukprot:GHVS01023130.1.p2 GENE.GHVS01023130.1~~GHVS01023130.1.p2  ORF type:complete len:179 (-),score=46.27 GHVS01023130.1:668-1204(-)
MFAAIGLERKNVSTLKSLALLMGCILTMFGLGAMFLMAAGFKAVGRTMLAVVLSVVASSAVFAAVKRYKAKRAQEQMIEMDDLDEKFVFIHPPRKDSVKEPSVKYVRPVKKGEPSGKDGEPSGKKGEPSDTIEVESIDAMEEKEEKEEKEEEAATTLPVLQRVQKLWQRVKNGVGGSD